MIQSIRKQMKVSFGDWGIGLGFTAGCLVFGLIFSRIMMAIEPFEPAEEAALTVTFGTLGAAIYVILYMGFSLLINFKLQVSMGETRRDFVVSYYITGVVGSMVLVLFVALAAAGTQAIYTWFYGEEVISDLILTILKWGIPAAFALPAVSSMGGALVLRFGKTAAWIIWAIWMIGGLGLPRFAENISEMPDSAVVRISTRLMSMLGNFSEGTWIILILLAGVIGLVVETCLLLRQEVRG